VPTSTSPNQVGNIGSALRPASSIFLAFFISIFALLL
jgi:hypothetical protein